MNGAFSTTFNVPVAPVGHGDIIVQAKDRTSRISASTLFVYIPPLALSPNAGPPGTMITVTGHHFSASGLVSLTWIDPDAGPLDTIGQTTATLAGDIDTTINVPQFFVRGKVYDVQAYDTQTGALGQARFTTQ
jgi:hypothetical protein